MTSNFHPDYYHLYYTQMTQAYSYFHKNPQILVETVHLELENVAQWIFAIRLLSNSISDLRKYYRHFFFFLGGGEGGGGVPQKFATTHPAAK